MSSKYEAIMKNILPSKKANHSFEPNSGFGRFFHPVFGLTCLGIKTLKNVAKDQEIFVNYRYAPSHAPEWYTSAINGVI